MAQSNARLLPKVPKGKQEKREIEEKREIGEKREKREKRGHLLQQCQYAQLMVGVVADL
jgi:hypothetical protein